MEKLHQYVSSNKISTELQNVGILVSRIPDISAKKSGHFPIVATNLSIFDIKWL